MQRQARRDTAPELALRSMLHRAGFRFRVDYPVAGTRRRADLAFPRLRLAVFVDGCFWHGCPEHGTWPKANAQWWREKITANQARETALLLKGGALSAPIAIANEKTITGTLGQENIEKGVKALVIGMASLFAFMIIYYRLFGVVATWCCWRTSSY